jgi:hypothetical protein
MFCSGCGKEMSEGSEFCSGCGKAVGGVTKNSDPTKILKQSEFRRFEKFMDAMSKKNDGKLTLFCDRVEWRGKVNDDIKADDIADAVILSIGSDNDLKITDNSGKEYKFLRKKKVSETIGSSSNLDSMIVTELESWRSAIDKIRGRL